MSSTRERRVERLRQQTPDIDLLVVSSAANKVYYSGFALSPGERHIFAGTLLIGDGVRRILVDSRFTEQAASEAAGWEVVPTTGGPADALARQLGLLGARRVGMEASLVSHADWQALAERCPGVDFVAIDDQLRLQRVVKEPAEVDAIAAACAIGDACFAHLVETCRPPMTEREVAWEIASFFHERGMEPSFESIVLVGARASMPHGQPGDVPLEHGAGLLVDFGCAVDGYCSDMTRTFFTGQPSDEARRMYAAVLEAQDRAMACLEEGVSGREVHELARAVISQAGFEPFEHGLGHGIGLDVHEAPGLRATSHDTLESGMVFSVEPGIYTPGRIGVRIEDLVHLTSQGPRLLTRAPRELVVV